MKLFDFRFCVIALCFSVSYAGQCSDNCIPIQFEEKTYCSSKDYSNYIVNDFLDVEDFDVFYEKYRVKKDRTDLPSKFPSDKDYQTEYDRNDNYVVVAN